MHSYSLCIITHTACRIVTITPYWKIALIRPLFNTPTVNTPTQDQDAKQEPKQSETMGVELRSTAICKRYFMPKNGHMQQTCLKNCSFWDDNLDIMRTCEPENSKTNLFPWILEPTRIIHVGEGLQILKRVLQQPTGPKPALATVKEVILGKQWIVVFFSVQNRNKLIQIDTNIRTCETVKPFSHPSSKKATQPKG